MRGLLTMTALLVLGIGTACSGGGGADDVLNPPGPLTLSFAPQTSVPAQGSIALVEHDHTGDRIVLEVRVTDVANVHGGSGFSLLYDPTTVRYVDYVEGTVLEQTGGPVNYFVADQVPGRVLVSVITLAADSADVSGGMPLVYLVFEAKEAGSTAVQFDPADSWLQGMTPPGPPEEIAGLQWLGGTLLAQ